MGVDFYMFDKIFFVKLDEVVSVIIVGSWIVNVIIVFLFGGMIVGVI